MFGRFGWAEILVIVVLVVILFGSNKIPGMMKNLADGLNIFKKEIKDTKKPEKKEQEKKPVAKKTKKVVKKK
ncbi:MAG: twin-arginine translocase TatA/TatE family subunit [Alphaproteobacteria bacterium]|nr:twin-arginine translocase TatA/TatE family subunit [Alphaproteobacteria bacterium]